MSIQDLIAIATFAIAIMGVVYAFGKRDAVILSLKEGLNGIGGKQAKFDDRLDRLGENYARLDQRVSHLQEECFGEEKAKRLRQSGGDKPYYSPNSGIEL